MAHNASQLSVLWDQLGITELHRSSIKLPIYTEALTLINAGEDFFQRPLKLTPEAYQAFQKMQYAASQDNVQLEVISGFRSYDYQASLIQKKLEQGQKIEEITSIVAAPGYSEHHTGNALDLHTPGVEVLETAFEQTDAFQWLSNHAGQYKFSLSFPKQNPYGIIYEPWHWCYHDA